MLLFIISCAFLFGTYAINCEIAGPIAVLIMCIVASARWKVDNHRMVFFFCLLIFIFLLGYKNVYYF